MANNRRRLKAKAKDNMVLSNIQKRKKAVRFALNIGPREIETLTDNFNSAMRIMAKFGVSADSALKAFANTMKTLRQIKDFENAGKGFYSKINGGE